MMSQGTTHHRDLQNNVSRFTYKRQGDAKGKLLRIVAIFNIVQFSVKTIPQVTFSELDLI